MSTQDVSIPVNVQEGIIRANLNSSMLLNFLMGVYTMVYAGTMYLYLSKKAGRNINRIVLSCISALYILCVSEFVVQWYFLNLSIVENGDTRESIFDETIGGGPTWMLILGDFQFYSAIMVSDILLIWRCLNVWGRSFRVITAPMILFIAEFGLFCAEMVLAGLSTRITGGPNHNLFNNIESALTFTSVGTTVVTTFLIGYRIHRPYSVEGLPPKNRGVFTHIAKLVIESAVAYSLVLLLDAISIVIPPFTELGTPWANVEYYVESVLIIVTGLAPTVLVARVALTDTTRATTNVSIVTHVSGLRFGSRRANGHRTASSVGDSRTSLELDVMVLTAAIEEKKGSTADSQFGSYQV